MDSICMPTGCEDIFAEEDSGPAWPQWLEAFRVPDEPRAAAYEDTPAHLRAAIRTSVSPAGDSAGRLRTARRPLPWWPSRPRCVRPPVWRRPSCPPSWPVSR